MDPANGGDTGLPVERSHVWDRRQGLSRALRVAVFAGPIAASIAVATVLSHVLPRADNLGMGVFWMAVIVVASLVTLVIVEKAARQLLPLAALLNLTLIFPDKAPARFAVARRTGKPSDLQAQLQRAHEGGHDAEAASMQRVIELVLALSVHDKASRGHSERVRVFTDLLADELKVAESGRNRLRWAALLHDIGKLEVAPAILNKPGKPSDEEWAVLHRHPEEGARLVSPLLPWLGEWGLAVVQHHERFDGTGYPHSLKGHEISLAARIVAVADSYEVMTAPRPYKRPMSVAAARQELVRVAGTQLDPVIVRAFLNVSVGRLWRTIGVGAWIAQVPTLGRLFSLGGLAGSGPAVGIATAATATVLAVAGVVGPAPPVVSPGPGSAVAVAPSQTAGPTPSNRAGAATRPPRVAPSSPAAVSAPTSAPTTAPSKTPTPTTAPQPTPAPPTPVATPTPPPPAPTPTPTAAPTPTPTPPPSWNCSACTNTSPGCTSYCSGNNKTCTTYCTGNNNTVCVTYCFGNNNKQCLSYCQGTDNPKCTQNCKGPDNPKCTQNCQTAAAVAALPAGDVRVPGLAWNMAIVDGGWSTDRASAFLV